MYTRPGLVRGRGTNMEVTKADLQMETDSKQNTTINTGIYYSITILQSNVQYGGWNQSESSWLIRWCGFWTGCCANAASESRSSGRGWKVLDSRRGVVVTFYNPDIAMPIYCHSSHFQQFLLHFIY